MMNRQELNACFVSWVKEELLELETAISDEDMVDAFFDLAGLALAGVIQLEPSERQAGLSAYLESQAKRSRPAMLHHDVVSAMIAAIKPVDNTAAIVMFEHRAPKGFKTATKRGE